MSKRLLPVLLLVLTPGLPAADRISASTLHSFSVPAHPLLLVSSGVANGDRTNSADVSVVLANLRAKLEELYKAASFPGATIGFALPDGRSGAVSVGLGDLENKTPLKPSDRMLAGSIGKTYVSAAMLQIVQEGKVDLDSAPVDLAGAGEAGGLL